MEPLTMFAAAMGLISVIHLCDSLALKLRRTTHGVKSQGKRNDWYCFFHMSDLIGTDNAEQTPAEKVSVTDRQKIEQRRRQQALRPRIQA